MQIDDALAQASWRLRGFFGAHAADDRVGNRQDACQCPLVEWLISEQVVDSDPERTQVGPESVFAAGEHLLPFPLRIFVALIDTVVSETVVTAREALDALTRAEHVAAQRLLPAAWVPGCDYIDVDGARCQRTALNHFIHCFIEDYPVAGQLPQHAYCREFAGRLCEECWQHLHLVVPPASWWGDNLDVLVVIARHAAKEEALV